MKYVPSCEEERKILLGTMLEALRVPTVFQGSILLMLRVPAVFTRSISGFCGADAAVLSSISGFDTADTVRSRPPVLTVFRPLVLLVL